MQSLVLELIFLIEFQASSEAAAATAAATPAVTAVDTEATPVMVVDTEDTAAAATADMAVATTGPAMVVMEDTVADIRVDMEAMVDIGKITRIDSKCCTDATNNSATKDIIRFWLFSYKICKFLFMDFLKSGQDIMAVMEATTEDTGKITCLFFFNLCQWTTENLRLFKNISRFWIFSYKISKLLIVVQPILLISGQDMAVVMEATEADTATAAMADMVATGNFLFNINVKVFHFHTHKLKLNV
jgi:hypothetical protein